MARVFRQLDKILFWATERRPGEEWLIAGEVRGDAFRDLRTKDNALSVYVIEREDQLDRLIAAYSAHREHVQAIDFALFDTDGLAEIGVEAVPSAGDVPDAEVSQWHRDLVHLSGSKLLAIAQLVQRTAELHRRMDKQVAQLISDAIARNNIDVANLKEKIRTDLGKPRYQQPPARA